MFLCAPGCRNEKNCDMAGPESSLDTVMEVEASPCASLCAGWKNLFVLGPCVPLDTGLVRGRRSLCVTGHRNKKAFTWQVPVCPWAQERQDRRLARHCASLQDSILCIPGRENEQISSWQILCFPGQRSEKGKQVSVVPVCTSAETVTWGVPVCP